MGWRSLGTSIESYNANNPAFDAGANTVTLDEEYDEVNCVIVLPTEMDVYDGMGVKDAAFVEQGTMTINDKEYKVVSKTLEGEFGGSKIF